MCEPDRQFIAKIEMAMRWSSVGGEEVGVKCGCMQRCCEGAMQGVRSCLHMVRCFSSPYGLWLIVNGVQQLQG